MVPLTAPPGFCTSREGRLQIVAREDLPQVTVLLRRWAAGALPPGRPLEGGRGAAAAFALDSRLSVVLRPYRRGGLVARFNQARYLGFSPRPFEELRTATAISAAGVPTPEPLGAAVLWDCPGVYRGAVATREVAGASNLWRHLQSVAVPARAAACAAAAAAARQLHHAGALHPDLNLQNFLVRAGGGGLEAWLIDLDGVRFAPVTARARRNAFERVCRSIRKLDPESAVITLACVEAFRAGL
ncbi:MAG: lipopolysaccharide kinase InaA family protein [Candidatus Binatia bacterium]